MFWSRNPDTELIRGGEELNGRKGELIAIVGERNVLDEPEILNAYSRDESFVLPLKPWFVVKPKNVAEVQEIVKWANETGTPLVPVSSSPPRFYGDITSLPSGIIPYS